MNPERQLDESRLQGFDLRLAAALHDVPVPAGLADRLLARLHAGENSAGHAAAPMACVLPLVERPAPAARIAIRRRTWMAASAAAVVLIATGAWLVFRPETQPPDAAELAATWYAALNNSSVSWTVSGNGPSGFPVPNSIRVPARGWTSVGKIVGAKGVVYDLGGAGRTAVLFVVRMPSDASLPSRPPVSPQMSTGLTIGVWQSGELRYVLVVSGDIRAYRDLIDSNSAPFAESPLPRPRSLTYRAAVL
jgi:hypothetical protein